MRSEIEAEQCATILQELGRESSIQKTVLETRASKFLSAVLDCVDEAPVLVAKGPSVSSTNNNKNKPLIVRYGSKKDYRIFPKCKIDLGLSTAILEWWYKDRVDQTIVEDAPDLLTTHDRDYECTPEDLDNDDTQPIERRRHAFASKIAAECVLDIPGVTANTRANQLVAHQWLVKRMRALHVRELHMPAILPYALLYVRTPRKVDIEVAQLACTPAFSMRALDGERNYHSQGRSTLLRPLGARYSRERPRAA